jgi:membrane protein YdbS with pleckstrin-like domain
MAEPQLDPEEILELEFEYAQSTAEQAQDDRATIMNLYLLLVGGVGSILVGFGQARGAEMPRDVYVVVFALLGVIGFFILMKLVRLRQAWYDSVLAMNQIKDFYLQKFPELEKAFRWRTKTIPPPGKLWTITFNLALLVAIIDSVALGIAVYLTGWRVANNDYAVGAFAAILFFLWQIWFYFFQLPSER